MFKSRLSPGVVLLLLLCSFAAMTCMRMTPVPPTGFVRCTNGDTAKKNKPLVCVDANTLIPDPYAARIWDVESDHGHASNRPIKVTWLTNTETNLVVKFKDDSCSATIKADCDGKGECTAKIKPIDWSNVPAGPDGKKRLRCTYSLMLGDMSKDPDADLIVNPCCW